jgi:hypothetical protein
MIDIYHNSGHQGTAILWTNILNNYKNSNKKLIHFDSDVIFIGNILDDIMIKLYNADLVGPIRSYKNNHNNRNDIRYLSDVCSTYCFGFNPSKISNTHDYDTLVNMVRGYHNPLGHPILDFFDPVSFDILKNKGTMLYIDYNLIGNMNIDGSKDNKYSKINNIFDVGDKIIHFSAIGSGINYIKLKEKGLTTNVPMGYIEAGLKSYNLFNYLVYNKQLESKYENLRDTLDSFKVTFQTKTKDIHI